MLRSLVPKPAFISRTSRIDTVTLLLYKLAQHIRHSTYVKMQKNIEVPQMNLRSFTDYHLRSIFCSVCFHCLQTLMLMVPYILVMYMFN
jgi:hypothetical protein